IPALIVAAAVGIMVLIGSLAGGTPTVEEAIERLKQPGGERTGGGMIGPASKQRYMDAQALTDHLTAGTSEAERRKLAGPLVHIQRNFTRAEEGEVQHFLLLALGRVWQVDPGQPEMNSPEAVVSRRQTMGVLLAYAGSPHVTTRKAALLAMVY